MVIEVSIGRLFPLRTIYAKYETITFLHILI